MNSPIDALYVSEMMGPCSVVPSPLVVHINSSTSPESLTRHHNGKKRLKLENITSRLGPIIEQIKNMRLVAVELQNIEDNVLQADDCKKLVEALVSSESLIYLALDTVRDVSMCSQLVQSLPSSTKRLTMLNCASSAEYRFPDTVNLECLHLAGQASSMTTMFTSCFPKLNRLTMMNTSQKKWKRHQIAPLSRPRKQDACPAACLYPVCQPQQPWQGHSRDSGEM